MTSLLDASVLRQLVRLYLCSNSPKTAEDFNYQAELKAVSCWRWLKGNEQAELVPGPHDDPRLKTAAAFVLKKWKEELLKEEEKVKQKHPLERKTKGKMDIDEESSSHDVIRGIQFYCTFCRTLCIAFSYIIFLSLFSRLARIEELTEKNE